MLGVYFGGLFAPFCFNSKMYQIPFLINHGMQNREKSVKTKEYCKRQSNTCLQLSKQSLIALGDVAKGCMRNLQIACKAIMLATYRWETVTLFIF